jgi:signal transduction histidine kinase
MGVVADDVVERAVLPALADLDRLAAIEDTGLLGHGDDTLDGLARVAAAVVDAPRAYVTMVTPEAQHLPGMVRLDDPGNTERQIPLHASVCQFAVVTGKPLVIPDSHQDPLVRDMPTVRRKQLGAYAGVPLRSDGGHILGTLCVTDPRPRDWGDEELALLEDLSVLAAREVDRRTTDTRDQRVQTLTRQVAQQLAPVTDAVRSLLDIADRSDEPRLRRYAGLTRRRMSRLVALAEQLREASDGTPQVERPPLHADLRSAVRHAVQSARAATGSSLVDLETPERPLPVRCDRSSIERSVTYLLVTALHHSTGDAPVTVRLRQTAGSGTHAIVADQDAEAPSARLTVLARHSRVPAGELARIVSFFAAVPCADRAADAAAEPAALRVAGGSVSAESGAVRGRSSADGLVLTVRWPLDVS